jgi:hypothetical protein
MINFTDFNKRIIAMFGKMYSNGDSSLDYKEISKMKRHHCGKMKTKQTDIAINLPAAAFAHHLLLFVAHKIQ